MKFYRLEAPWRSFDDYFTGPLCYRSARLIGEIPKHGLELRINPGEAICGLWVLGDPNNAIIFWNNESSMQRGGFKINGRVSGLTRSC